MQVVAKPPTSVLVKWLPIPSFTAAGPSNLWILFFFLHNPKGGTQGSLMGCIWETSCKLCNVKCS